MDGHKPMFIRNQSWKILLLLNAFSGSTVGICITLTVYTLLVSMTFVMLIRDTLKQANKQVGVYFLTSIAPPSGQCRAYISSPYLAMHEGIALRFVFSKLSPVMECFSLLHTATVAGLPV